MKRANVSMCPVHANGDMRPAAPAAAELPAAFLEWQAGSRKEMFGRLVRGEPVRFLASHLPVVATRRPDGGINLANKGLGLVPRDEHLGFYTRLLRDALAAGRRQAWAESLPGRVDAALHLLSHPEHVDPMRLGSLEIFEGESFRNIRENPRVSLLFTGEGPRYPSFQVDVETGIRKPGEPLHDFLVASRLLFEHEHFHIAQPDYPYAYEFTVRGVREKTPKRRCPMGAHAAAASGRNRNG